MKTIGFAGKFYTLWDVKVERVDVAIGAWYNKIVCTYYRNLSKDLDEAIKKAGTSNVDETLRGKRKSFEIRKPLVIEPKIMTDRERLFRIILVNDRENTLEARQAALQRMLELGYIIVQSGIYEIQGDVRYTNVWWHKQLEISIKGSI